MSDTAPTEPIDRLLEYHQGLHRCMSGDYHLPEQDGACTLVLLVARSKRRGYEKAIEAFTDDRAFGEFAAHWLLTHDDDISTSEVAAAFLESIKGEVLGE